MTALLPLVRQAMAVDQPGLGAGGERITMETITSVGADGKHVVLGHALPVTGLRVYRAGDLVPVAWKNGVPVVIVGHNWRRAQYHPHAVEATKGIVEELLVGNFDETLADVWYRNQEKMVKLALAGSLQGHTPEEAKWGLDGKSLAVRCTDGSYAIFTLDRADPNLVEENAPGEATFKGIGKLLDSSVSLTAVTMSTKRSQTNVQFVGQLEQIYYYYWVPVPSLPAGGYWWYGLNLSMAFGPTQVNQGTASGSSTKTFPLKDVLSGSVADYLGLTDRVTGTVLDWYLDVDLHVKFLIRVDWNQFNMGVSGGSPGTVQRRIGCENNFTQDVISAPAGYVALLGRQKSPTLGGEWVAETHLFLFDGTANSVLWATANAAVTFTRDQKNLAPEHIERTHLLDPGSPDGKFPPFESTCYRVQSASWSQGWPNQEQSVGSIGVEGAVQSSSTGTGQLFDPALCPFLTGPFVTDTDTPGSPEIASIVGSYNTWRTTYQREQRSSTQHWHYRIAYEKLFQTRVNHGTMQEPKYEDEARLFLVIERYPFIGGFLNDLPQIGVFILKPDGSVVLILRGFQYGLSGASLSSGNGHRILWTLSATGAGATTSYIVTDLSTGAEQTLNSNQLAIFLQGKARLFSPDFFWDRIEPQVFYAPAALPALTEDEVLRDYATLVAVEGGPEGSVRMVNDEEILTPLDRYSAT